MHLPFCLCRACVEVKPILYIEQDTGATIENLIIEERSCYLGFKHENWHDSCIQKCVVHGKICAVILSITRELTTKICSDTLPADCANGDQCSITKVHIEKLSKFCIYLLDKSITENAFAWEDIMVSL